MVERIHRASVRAAEAAQDFRGDGGEHFRQFSAWHRGHRLRIGEPGFEVDGRAEARFDVLRHRFHHRDGIAERARIAQQFADAVVKLVGHFVGIFVLLRRRDPAHQSAQEDLREMHLPGLRQQRLLDEAHDRQPERRRGQEGRELQDQRRPGVGGAKCFDALLGGKGADFRGLRRRRVFLG